MPHGDTRSRDDALAVLSEAVHKRSLALRDDDRGDYVGSELATVSRALARIQAEGLAPGPVFCEWGSGLGGVCGVATLHGFSAVGIEIRRELVDSARAMAESLDLPMTFAQGTFLLPGDEDLVAETTYTRPVFDPHAWEELDLTAADCHVVFAYPWPGEERSVDRVFARHAAPGALLLTFHDWDRVLVQRKRADDGKLVPLAWM